MSDDNLKKEDILFHIDQIRLDPSYINSIDNPTTFNAVSEVLQGGRIDNVLMTQSRNKMRNVSGGDRGHNATYNQHYKKHDNNTKQHNAQYQNKREGD